MNYEERCDSCGRDVSYWEANRLNEKYSLVCGECYQELVVRILPSEKE
ncbi:hypothetical protein [Bacillus taeanensis]|nr:hypothetical protein [Bacillus taeanensis]